MSADPRTAGHRASDELTLPGVIGCSSALHEVIRVTRKVSPSRACVLIVGETGTGKELIALRHSRFEPTVDRAIHKGQLWRFDGKFA